MEIWKDIQDYEGYYQISSHGRVKNIKTGKILLGDINNIGYRRVCLYIPKKKRFFVHRLVAFHFCDGFKENLVVNHKDGNKANNHMNNLEWVTRSENDKHAYLHNLRKPYPCYFKRKVIAYDLNTNDVVKNYQNVQECSVDLSVSRSNIYSCCNGRQASCRRYGLRYE